MASFISALSLLILVLSNGCFTLPILDQQLSSAIYSSIQDYVTTGETLNLRLLTDDETSMLPDLDKKEATDEHIGFEMSTSMNGLSEEKTAQALRSFDEFSTSEPMTFTTEESYHHKRHHEDLPFTTIESATEQSYHDTRENKDLLLSTSEPMTFTTESSDDDDEHKRRDLSLTTVEPITQVAEFERRSFNGEFENETENGTQQMKVELTTNDMLLSTSSFVPKIWTSESSTEKYIGHLKQKNDDDNEYAEERSTESMKILRKPSGKSKTGSSKKPSINSEEGNLQEDNAPTAIFDQKALDKVANIPSDLLVLDENDDLLVTGRPEKIFPSTMAYKEKESLNQGSTLLLFLLAALLLCACVLASTLAFVKNRHTLKRKSRITEMEAHLDEHYHHPFLFPQHHQKQ